MKKAIALALAVVCLILAGCGEKEAKSGGNNNKTPETTASAPAETESGNIRLTFAESINMDRIKQLAGKTVEIIGYMATVSPVNGQYLYLMNLPYQSCPYCVPNTQQLSNTIAVYAKDGDKFDFTDGPINVIGTMETGDFSDEYGYTYNYRIKDAVYTEVNSSEASEKLALWEKITNANVASDVYAMFDFVDFECNWPNYTAKFEEGDAYLYPADVEYFEKNQYKVESYDDYFSALAKQAQSIDAEIMNDLVGIINSAKDLVNEAKAERADGKYTYDQSADRYTLNNGEALRQKAQDLYLQYATWLENFSLSN
ncbi:MAG: hypothetical protein IJT70_00435 [Clostridia bacterium]|nr:hypothetical protein [Clostridia bacterium]